MRKEFTISILLTVLVLAAFGQIVTHDFVVWDDDKNIYANPYIEAGSIRNVPAFWRAPYEKLYIPVTYTAWSLIAAVSGATTYEKHGGAFESVSPTLYHAASIILHLASVSLVVLLIWRLLGRKNLTAAIFGAGIFALHPLQVEAVAWATGMKDLLSGFLSIAAMLLYLHAAELAGAKPSSAAAIFKSPRYWCALLLFALALLAKPGVVVVPALIALLQLAFHRPPWKPLIAGIIPFFLAAILTVALTLAVQPTGPLALPLEDIPLWKRPAVALSALGVYLSKLVVPIQFSVDYGLTPSLALAETLGLALMLVLGLWLFVREKQHRAFYAAAFSFAVLAVLPTLGLIPYAFQVISTVADRYFYLSMIGISLAAAGWLTFTKKTWPKRAMPIVLVILTGLTALQARHWRNSFTLFQHTLKINPNSAIAANNLGVATVDPRAGLYFDKAISINPEFPIPYKNMALLLCRQEQYEEALPYWRKLTELAPNHAPGHSGLGTTLDHLRRHDEAIASHRKALTLSPRDPDITTQLAYSLANHGNLGQAIDLFNQAIELHPTGYQHWLGLAKIRQAQNDLPAAKEAAQKALENAENHRPPLPDTELPAIRHQANQILTSQP